MTTDPAPVLLTPSVRLLLDALSEGAEEARVVGGAVRDALLGLAIGDVDVATTCPPDETIRRAQAKGWKAIPTGIEHGTVTVVIGKTAHEVTTLRRDIATDGRRAVVTFSRDFKEDAARRDFTLNTLSMDAAGVIHDDFGGISDARAGRIRFVGEPKARIAEDYLRILRFFRFHASHGRGPLDPHALEACAALKGGLTQLSRERIRQELLKLLVAGGVLTVSKAMRDIGLWPLLLGDGPVDLDLLARTVLRESLLARAPDAMLRLAALTDLKTSRQAEELQKRLALSTAQRERLSSLATLSPLFTETASARRLAYHSQPDHGFPALILSHARRDGDAQTLHAMAEALRHALVDLPANPFSGAQLIARGLPPGPRMGHILKRAEAAWLDADLPEEESAIARILLDAIAETPD